MKTSVIIPTYNREDDLNRCLTSISIQSHLPDEVIVIDDGEIKDFSLFSYLSDKGINVIYRRKKEKGLTRSRNLGIRLASGDIIFFFDDDVILKPDYIENMLKTYKELLSKDPMLGGIGGIEINLLKGINFLNYAEYIYNVFFLISPVKPYRFTISGFSNISATQKVWKIYKLEHPIKVEFLGGCSFSFLKKVFEDFLFSEDYHDNYCLGEDKDFCIRVNKKFHLYLNPKAQLIHNVSQSARADMYKRGYNFIMSNYRHFSRYIKKTNIEVLFFFYSVMGFILKRIFISFFKNKEKEIERIRGCIKAIKEIIGLDDEKATSRHTKL